MDKRKADFWESAVVQDKGVEPLQKPWFVVKCSFHWANPVYICGFCAPHLVPSCALFNLCSTTGTTMQFSVHSRLSRGFALPSHYSSLPTLEVAPLALPRQALASTPGIPEWIRTTDRLLRRQLRYPTEPRVYMEAPGRIKLVTSILPR